jgi:hypothetical protein
MHPESNYLAIASIVISTFVCFWLFKKLSTSNLRSFKLVIIAALSLSFLVGVIAPSFSKYENNVDTFHHGEQLAPAAAYDNGKKPYTDLFFLRGAGEDVIAPWASFKLFGK